MPDYCCPGLAQRGLGLGRHEVSNHEEVLEAAILERWRKALHGRIANSAIDERQLFDLGPLEQRQERIDGFLLPPRAATRVELFSDK